MKTITVTLLSVLLLTGCGDKTAPDKTAPQEPPIDLEVIAPAVAQKFTERFADSSVRVGEVRFDNSSNVYHVEVFYKSIPKDKELRYVMEFSQITDADRPELTIYSGSFPTIHFGPEVNASSVYLTVQIDEMMNERSDSQGPGQPGASAESTLEDKGKPDPETEGNSQ